MSPQLTLGSTPNRRASRPLLEGKMLYTEMAEYGGIVGNGPWVKTGPVLKGAAPGKSQNG
jgi:hypothetical protein